MGRYTSVWVSFGILSPFLLAVGAVKCSEKETLLRPSPSNVTQPTDCLLDCTGMTYIKKLQLRDNHNIRLKDSTEEDLREYCWSTELQCTTGESFESAYVVLTVDVSAVGLEQLEVKVVDPAATMLQVHSSPTIISESCGLLYDVTQHFSSQDAGTSFCVQVVTEEDVIRDKVLKCPPFLVTVWQRNPNQSNQQGAG